MGILDEIFRKKDPAPKKLRVGLAGGGEMLRPVAKAFRGRQLTASIALFHPDEHELSRLNRDLDVDAAFSDFDAFKNSVDAVEVLELEENRHELTTGLLKAGKHVSLQKPWAESLEQAEELIAAAKKSGAALRVNDEAFFFDPCLKLKALIDSLEIGEISSIRIKANLCGRGGFGPRLGLLKGRDPLLHPAFDRFALALELLGGVESVSAYINGFNKNSGGQAVVGFKYEYPGRYGVMELTFSPLASIRGCGLPCDDVIEVAGTDGIIWVNHFRGKSSEEPWLEVRRGKKYFSFGIGSGMELEWERSLAASARNFLESVSRGKTPKLSAPDALKGLKFLLAARQAAETGAEVLVQP